ncbi:MAG: efflux RND transporter periplasmic adaptor subunit [Verrucomicrobiae bacterium]|nr:efflux RND transporter periplasmic adaptor subunit [Verrucomicrobiae bacterium]
MKKAMIVMLATFGAVVLLLGGVKVMQVRAAIEAGKKSAPPPPTVEVGRVQRVRWEPTLRFVGTLRAEHGVTVSTDLPGIVAAIEFESGQTVQKGQRLVRLDTRQEEAHLQLAEARRDLARANWERQKQLRESGVGSAADWDMAESEYRQALAAVEEARAIIERKEIVAPFAGQLGLRQVCVGQYLNAGSPIVRLESLDPVLVEFAVPQSELQRVMVGSPLRVRVSGWGTEEFTGRVTALDARVEPASRNIRVEGNVANPQARLRPGMFVHVDVVQPASEVLVVPASAIQYAPYGDSVFVVKHTEEGTVVEQRFVKRGGSRGNLVEISSGLEEGMWVVTTGGFKLRAGMPVQVRTNAAPVTDREPVLPNT